MTSFSTSGRQHIVQTCKFRIMFGSRFLDNGSTDSKKMFTVLETAIQYLEKITNFYRDIHTDTVYSHTAYDVII